MEKTRLRGASGWGQFFLSCILFLFGGWLLVFLRTIIVRSEEVLIGKELFVAVPLRMCQTCCDHARGLSKRDQQNVLRELLAKTPVYRRLLHRYPEARLVVLRVWPDFPFPEHLCRKGRNYRTFPPSPERPFGERMRMSPVLLFAIILLYTAVLWVAVLFIYSTLVESFDFGVLSTFAWKSAILVTIVAAVEAFVPYGGWFAIFVWALGLLILFRKDLWEMRILIVMIWVSNLVVGWIIRLLTLRLLVAYEP